MTRHNRINGINHKAPPSLGGTQIHAHRDLQQIVQLPQPIVLAIPVPCRQHSVIPAMQTNFHHPHNLKFVAPSPTTTNLVAALILPTPSRFAMIGMMTMSGINQGIGDGD